MLMDSVAWTPKARLARRLPDSAGSQGNLAAIGKRLSEKTRLLKMQLRTSVNSVMRVPCQLVRSGQRIDRHLLVWNDSQPRFWNLVEAMMLKMKI
jgi:hypothetical protein